MGTFNDRVFEVVARIPQGFVTAYGDIARAIGEPRKARFVGYAMHAAPGPDKLPCHRVVFKDGSLCEAYVFGGAGVQHDLLEREGVAFIDETHVDMTTCHWIPGSDTASRPIDIDWEAEMAED